VLFYYFFDKAENSSIEWLNCLDLQVHNFLNELGLVTHNIVLNVCPLIIVDFFELVSVAVHKQAK
jgi:hypothetical protein